MFFNFYSKYVTKITDDMLVVAEKNLWNFYVTRVATRENTFLKACRLVYFNLGLWFKNILNLHHMIQFAK